MGAIVAPLGNWKKRINATLHGRSIPRPANVSGHNVFKGYTTWALNGHKGVGDALDLFAAGGAKVVAAHDGTITGWRNDASKLEVIYLEGEGFTSVYAHVNLDENRVNLYSQVKAGDRIATVRSDLNDPHLHFELWERGRAIWGATPAALLANLATMTLAASWRIEMFGMVGQPVGSARSQMVGNSMFAAVSDLEAGKLLVVDRTEIADRKVKLRPVGGAA